MERASMYRMVTDGIEVTVEPEFAPDRSNPERGDFFWVYTVEIRNLRHDTVQLRNRHWEITDALGNVQHVRGVGVVGEQPVIRPGAIFRYSSGCPLRTTQGVMVGTYEMVSDNGSRLEVAIPAFSLDSPYGQKSLH
jgi:ApaG protein